MEYSKGKIKNVYLIRFDDDEDLIDSLNKFIIDKKIKCGTINFIGALKKGKYVKAPNMKNHHNTLWNSFNDGREVIGIGTITRDINTNEPFIHIHASFGGKNDSKTGCLREISKIYLTVEAVVYELNIKATRKIDEKTKLKLLNFN
jgi:uncharacterized protein